MKEYMVERADGKRVFFKADDFRVREDHVLRFYNRDEELGLVQSATVHPHRWIYVREVYEEKMAKECDCSDELQGLFSPAVKLYIETLAHGVFWEQAVKIGEALSQEKG